MKTSIFSLAALMLLLSHPAFSQSRSQLCGDVSSRGFSTDYDLYRSCLKSPISTKRYELCHNISRSILGLDVDLLNFCLSRASVSASKLKACEEAGVRSLRHSTEVFKTCVDSDRSPEEIDDCRNTAGIAPFVWKRKLFLACIE